MSELAHMKILTSKAFQILVIVFFTTVAYSNIFQNDFATDDVGYFLNWQIPKDFRNIPKILTTDSVPRDEQGVYRPFKALFLMLSFKLWGVEPFGYHLVSLLVHLGATVLVYFIAREILLNAKRLTTNAGNENHALSIKRSALSNLPFITALLFGLHPVHTEAVTFMLASYDSIGSAFFLASFYLYVKYQTRLGKNLQAGFVYWASVGLAALAFLTYELTLSLPLVLLLYEVCFGARARKKINWGRLISLWPYFSLWVFYGVWRLILGVGIRGDYLGDSFFKTMLVVVKALVLYLWLFIWPLDLSLDHEVFPGVYSVIYKLFSDAALLNLSQYKIEILLSIFVLASLLALALKSLSKRPVMTFAIGWFFITLLPVSFILPQSSIMAERYSYLAVFSWCLLIGYLFKFLIFNFKFSLKIGNFKFQISKEAKNFFVVSAIVILAAFYFVRTYSRNRDWRDTLTVWLVMGKQNPGNLMTNYTIGKIYQEKNQIEPAIAYFQKALVLQPQTLDINFRLGRLYQATGQLDLAVGNYQLATGVGNKYAFFARWELERLVRIAKFGSQEKPMPKDNWRQYRLGRLSFSYPAWWLVTREGSSVFLDNPQDYFSVEFSASELKEKQSAQDYLAGLENIGNLLKLTETKIGGADFGVAKFFKDEPVERLEFYLFRGRNVMRIWVYPVNLPSMKEFDRMIGTIKFAD